MNDNKITWKQEAWVIAMRGEKWWTVELTIFADVLEMGYKRNRN